jgi:chromate transport protein ChrA
MITGLVFVAAGAYVLSGAALLLWLSGDWRWVEGWIFGVWWASFMAAIVLWLYYRDPALLAERFRMPGSGGESRADMAILIGIKIG